MALYKLVLIDGQYGLKECFKKPLENEIMVNVHDNWRPTGEQRTRPNLMTDEGIRGNEEMPDATHNTVLPFTKYIVTQVFGSLSR